MKGMPMAIDKKSKLSAMRDEVKELHPLLEILLPKLPFVTKVEYTQRNTEMGADFVVIKQNATLRTVEYLGVIAKIGKIHQDFVDLERQIDECAIPRTILGGKEKVRLEEIWVIVTETITKGAQEKIHDKYAARKISFIDGSCLIQLIDDHMPHYWTGLAIEVSEYLTKLRIRNEEEDRSVSLIPIISRNFYIEQDLYRFPPIQYKLNPTPFVTPKKVEFDELLNQSKLVLIEGGMGSGKSKLMRHIVDRLTEPEEFETTKMVPVPTTYKILQDKYNNAVDRLIADVVPEQMRQTHTNLTFLILVDGIDEKYLPVEKHVETLSSLAQAVNNSPNTKAIVTSRYLKGLEGSCAIDDEIVRYELAHLTISKIVQFIKLICSNLNLTKRFIEDLKKSQLFKELPHSPIAAILLAKLINENAKELPSNMTELYAQYTEISLGRWEIDKGLQTLKEYQALDHILIQLAKHIMQNEIRFISFEKAFEIVNSYLLTRNLEIEPNKLLSILMKRCEIMMVDPDKKLIGFKHRTFAEFFFAKDMLRTGPVGVLEKAFSIYWMNCVFFYLGLLKDCPAELSQIIELVPRSEAERWIKIINMSNYFLAAYASPYDVVVRGLAAIIADAAELFNLIVERKIKSPFACLSQMHLLYLMQLIIRDSYSYQFFKPAIEDTALIIEDGPYSETVKAYALFFLNVAYIDLGGIESFDFLLKRHTKDLPLDLSLAIKHESRELAERSILMRRQDRRIRKLIKGSRSLSEQIRKMYDRPLVSPGEDLKKSKALGTTTKKEDNVN
jgi:hypothetical protein